MKTVKYGNLIAVSSADYAAAIKNAADKDMFRQLEVGLRKAGMEHIVMEEDFYNFIKASINDIGILCSCGNNNTVPK